VSPAFQDAAETRAYFSVRGVDVTGEEQTKAATALKFFSDELRGA
jgi:hypothetical protein